MNLASNYTIQELKDVLIVTYSTKTFETYSYIVEW